MRIVSLAPAITEIIYALGAADDLAAVTRFCDWPIEAAKKEKVGAWVNAEPEKLNMFQPDIILASYFLPESVKHYFEKNKLLVFEPKNLWEVFESIREIGRAVGAHNRAEEIAGQMKNGFDKIRSSRAEFIPRVYMEEWFDPPLAAGHWVPELAAIAGGEEVIAENSQPSQTFSLAAMAIADPDLIICHWTGWGERTDRDRILNRDGWQDLRAMRENKVFFADDALINRPGPRLVEGARALKKIFVSLQ